METASSRDYSLGARYHLLSARLAKGETLKEALNHTPHFLPVQIVAILDAGIDLGDLERVLPATHKLLQDANSKMKSAVNYVVLLLFSFIPMLLSIIAVFNYVVLPKFLQIAEDMGEGGTSILLILRDNASTIQYVYLGILLFILLVVFLYAGGERLRHWIDPLGISIFDRLDMLWPWKKKRLKRDFSTMLALLLDIGSPEDRAVEMAAKSTSNRTLMVRANQVILRLKQGEGLTEAIRYIDDAGEFRWRLTNAAHARRGFVHALTGWHEFLDAKAYQQEQAVAQTVTTSIVILHGTVIGFFAVGVFYLLIHFMEIAGQ